MHRQERFEATAPWNEEYMEIMLRIAEALEELVELRREWEGP
jgi:hypothetical protein